MKFFFASTRHWQLCWRILFGAIFWPKLCAAVLVGLFTTSFLVQLLLFIWKNRPNNHIYSYAKVKVDNHTVQLSLRTSQPIKIQAGQYINLWMPTVSLQSVIQSHPFTVTSWSEAKQTQLDLPCKGFTKNLLEYGASHPDKPCLVFFSGPHGHSAPVQDYETVVMVASGYGIVAHLPYLKQLLYGHRARKGRTRRVHLI